MIGITTHVQKPEKSFRPAAFPPDMLIQYGRESDI